MAPARAAAPDSGAAALMIPVNSPAMMPTRMPSSQYASNRGSAPA